MPALEPSPAASPPARAPARAFGLDDREPEAVGPDRRHADPLSIVACALSGSCQTTAASSLSMLDLIRPSTPEAATRTVRRQVADEAGSAISSVSPTARPSPRAQLGAWRPRWTGSAVENRRGCAPACPCGNRKNASRCRISPAAHRNRGRGGSMSRNADRATQGGTSQGRDGRVDVVCVRP